MKASAPVLAALAVLALGVLFIQTRFQLAPADCHEYLPTAFVLDRWTGHVRVITLHEPGRRFTLEHPLIMPAPREFTPEMLDESNRPQTLSTRRAARTAFQIRVNPCNPCLKNFQK